MHFVSLINLLEVFWKYDKIKNIQAATWMISFYDVESCVNQMFLNVLWSTPDDGFSEPVSTGRLRFTLQTRTQTLRWESPRSSAQIWRSESSTWISFKAAADPKTNSNEISRLCTLFKLIRDWKVFLLTVKMASWLFCNWGHDLFGFICFKFCWILFILQFP